MEEIAHNHDGIRTRRDHALDRQAESVGHVRLSLIDAGRSLTMVLPNAQVGIGEVSQSHTGNVMGDQD
jgi:hypothetical protein